MEAFRWQLPFIYEWQLGHSIDFDHSNPKVFHYFSFDFIKTPSPKREFCGHIRKMYCIKNLTLAIVERAEVHGLTLFSACVFCGDQIANHNNILR